MTQAFFDGYAGMELELPSGEMVKVKALTLEQGARWMRIWEQHRGTKDRPGDPEAKYTIFRDFPKEVGLEAELNRCTLEEFWEVFDCFFARRRKPGTPANPVPPTSPSPGMTS